MFLLYDLYRIHTFLYTKKIDLIFDISANINSKKENMFKIFSRLAKEISFSNP